MGDREDYAEPGTPPAWDRSAVRRRFYTFALGGLLLVVAGVLVFLLLSVKSTDRYYNVHMSLHRAKVLAQACEVYREHRPDNVYPATLSDLTRPVPGGGPGQSLTPARDARPASKSPTDAWGNPFRYALVPNAAGELEPHVWAERTRNGKTTLHGAKLASDGTVVVFGLPED